MFSTLSRLALVAALAGATLAVTPTEARACSCVPPDIVTSYNNHSDVFIGRVLARFTAGHTVYFGFQIRRTYKGCTESRQVVLLSTPDSGAACGTELSVGRSYLITGNRVNDGQFSIGSCGYNRPTRSLTDAEWEFLQTRYNCCGDHCECVGGQPPVLCFADPCSVNSCEEGECTANYCGGCFAEFYNELGQAVCTPCESDDDCSWGQVCSRDRECRSECYSDSDCERNQYCGHDSACHDCRTDVDSLSSTDRPCLIRATDQLDWHR